MKVIGTNGGRTLYAPPIVSTACYRVDTLYTFQNVRAEGYAVDTNTVPTGAFRGFGNSQMTFALETMIDMAAETPWHRPGRPSASAMRSRRATCPSTGGKSGPPA